MTPVFRGRNRKTVGSGPIWLYRETVSKIKILKKKKNKKEVGGWVGLGGP